MPRSGIVEIAALAARIVNQNTWYHCIGVAPIAMRAYICGNDAWHSANSKRKLRHEYNPSTPSTSSSSSHALASASAGCTEERWLDDLANCSVYELPSAFAEGPDFSVPAADHSVNYRYSMEQLVNALARCYLGALVVPGSSSNWKYNNTEVAAQFDGMMNMIRRIANDKGILVFNLYTMLNEAAKCSAYDGKQHLNERGKSLIAEHDVAIMNVLMAWTNIKLVAHESYRSGGYFNEGIDEDDVLFKVSSTSSSDATASADATASMSTPNATASADAVMFMRTNWHEQRVPHKATVCNQDLQTASIRDGTRPHLQDRPVGTWKVGDGWQDERIYAAARPRRYEFATFETIHKKLYEYSVRSDADFYNRYGCEGLPIKTGNARHDAIIAAARMKCLQTVPEV